LDLNAIMSTCVYPVGIVIFFDIWSLSTCTKLAVEATKLAGTFCRY
jgi:hypothetical protein